ncbi:MAG: glycosyltransferase [Christensenellaceae bacterium]
MLCTGRYSKEKAQSVLIEAAAASAHKDDLKLIFAGDGPYKNG